MKMNQKLHVLTRQDRTSLLTFSFPCQCVQACEEPYIIATDRHLSAMHPLFKLLAPHFLFTARINADARGVLVSFAGSLAPLDALLVTIFQRRSCVHR